MSEDNVVNFTGITSLDLDPQRVLEQATKAGLKKVVILGYNSDVEDGDGEYFASSIADGADVVWLLERMKLKLLRLADGE